MRRVSFVLMILAVAGTSSVRGQQPKIGEALRDKVRDAVLEAREPASDARPRGSPGTSRRSTRGARGTSG